jgi:beta-glucosidase
MRDFPEGFTFGTSAAAHQVEGGNVNNDWWAWEHQPRTTCVEPSGDAIDFWHRYADDAALLGSLGLPAHRMSLEWSRIEPAPGEWSTAALDHYRRILEALHANGISPYVTLHHFTIPRWLSEAGGWLAPDAVERFGAYAARVGAALGDLIPHVCTINEPQIVSLFGYRLGYHAPGLRHAGLAHRVTRRLIAAHEAAVEAVKTGAGAPEAGLCLQLPDLEPAHDDAACVAAYEELRHEMETVFLDDLAGDWVGVQYYSRMRVDPAYADGFAPPPDGAPLTAMGWELNPEGLHRAIAAAAATGLPVHVTENGIATEDDAERVDYLETHLAQVARAIADGLDVRAYLYWSAWDNFEWAEGYRPRFGLIGIDRDDDLRRTVRPSARALAAVAKTGKVDALRSANPG